MAVKDVLRKLLGYRLGGGGFTEMAIPPGWNYQAYLQAYGNIGWLFGAVSLIANSVASSEWMLYRRTKKTEREEIDDHPLVDLWNHVNPFQTQYQFLLMLETYIELVGEAFIVLNFNRLRVPAEMWLAPPGNMTIIPSAQNYISHYEFHRAGNKVLRLELPEVIHILNPNPANPYRGTGAARSIATDLDSEFYAGKYQNKLFYNDATPRLFLEFPDLPPAEERKRLRDEFSDMHQGWRNAYKPGFLWGGAKANTVSLSARDMDFAALRTASKKLILGAYHIPESLIGAAEVGSRARAEADEYIFGKYTIRPALQRIREALNEQLCPLFEETLEWDFISPVPEDTEKLRLLNREDFRAGLITREEARLAIGMDVEAQGTFLLPFNLYELPAKQVRRTVHKAWVEAQKDAYWKTYIAKTESEERAFITALKGLWTEQEKEVIRNLKAADGVDDALFNYGKAEEKFDETMRPLVGEVFNRHYGDAQGLVSPENPHADSKDWGLLNTIALAWIKSRSLELAQLLNNTSIDDLRKTLAEGFELGESIPKLTKRVTEYYGEANKVRARMVARTETIAASNEGALQGYGDLGVEKTEWYTAPDERRCEECSTQHGVQYALKDSHGLIPAHPNCRCVWVPVV